MLTEGKYGSSGCPAPDPTERRRVDAEDLQLATAEARPGASELTPWPGRPKRLFAGGCLSNDE